MLSSQTSKLDRALLEAVLDAAVDGIVMIDERGRIQSFNKAAERIFGYTREEVMGENIAMLAAEPYQSAHDGYIASYLATGQGRIIGVGRRRLTALRKDGSEFPIELGVSDARIGSSRMFVGLIRDMSEEEAQKNALADALARLQAVADTLVDGFITIDANATVASINKAAEQMFGYSAGEVIGRNVAMLMPESTARSHDGYIARYQTSGDKRIIGATRPERGRRKSGVEFPLELAVNEMTISGARMFVGLVRDVTERVEHENERSALIGELKSALSQRDALLAEVYHRVKNNLMFIEAMLAIEGDNVGDASLIDAFDRVRRRIRSLGYVHQQILQSPDLETIDLRRFLNDICANLVEGMGADERGITVRVDVASIPIKLDRAIPFALVVNELLSNALKHAFPGRAAGTVTVRVLREDDGEATLAVSDDGVGVGAGSKSSQWSGGKILRALVVQLKARMDVRSDDGGTTVEVRVPLSQTEPAM